MTFTRWLFESEDHFAYDPGMFGYRDERVCLKRTAKDISIVTYKVHLIEAFRKWKERTGHSTKLNESNAILDGIKLLWGKHLRAGQYKTHDTNNKRHRGFKVQSLRDLEIELSLRFRDPVILEILKHETT